MKKILEKVSYIVIVAGIITATTFYYAENFYHKMVEEDGPFETLTALVLLLISILFIIRITKQRKSRNTHWIVLGVIIAIGTFFGFGEEISWGQRIFGIHAGEYFMQHNLQGETNLHNLEIGGVKLNKLIFSQGLVLIFGTYFVLGLILYRRWSFFKKQVDLWGLPIPQFKHTVIMLVCTGIILVVPDPKIWELWEAIFAAILLLVFLDPYNQEEKLMN